MSLTINLKVLIYTLLVICTSNTFAQKTEFKIYDKHADKPIDGILYEYGNEVKVSDVDGIITFDFIEKETMFLSHVNYGSWELSEQALKTAIGEKILYKESKIVDLFPVTIIALKPNVIPDERINIDHRDRMEHDAAKILAQVPSINGIKKSGGYGFDPVFRGYKYDQLNIVMNGAQSATAACPNRMDPPTSQMAPNMIDRIEVLKGPYALRYGVGLGGTINFIPSKIKTSLEKNVYGRISTEYQSNGNILRSEAQLGVSLPKADLSLFGAWSQGGDYTAGNDQEVHADFSRGSFGGVLGFKIKENHTLRISGLYNIARDVDFAALPMDLRTDNTLMFSANYEINLNQKRLHSWKTAMYGSLVDHLMDNRIKILDPRKLNAETSATTRNFGGRTEGLWLFENSKLYTGLDMRVEGAEGTRVREFLLGPNAGKVLNDNAWQDGAITKAGLFLEYHLKSDALQYIISARTELNNSNINDPSSKFTDIYPEYNSTQINPSISLGMVYHLGTHSQASLWLGRVQRSGSLTERFINYFSVGQDAYEILGNPEINPEINNQVDLTYKFNNGKTSVNVDIFLAYLQDYISSVIDTTLKTTIPHSPGVRQVVNLDKAMKTGIEVNWNQYLAYGISHNLGCAYTYAQDLENDEPLPEISPLDFNYALYGSFLNSNLHPEISMRYVMEQSRISETFGETETPSFAVMNIKLSYNISKSILVRAGINNLFNEVYYEHLNRVPKGATTPIYERGRNFFISTNIHFD